MRTVCISLTEYEIRIKSFLILFLGDHIEFVHLLEDGPHTSLGISSACLSHRIVERRALRKAGDESALGKCKLGSLLAEIVHGCSLDTDIVVAHRSEVDVEL